jgi:hypothetical protein
MPTILDGYFAGTIIKHIEAFQDKDDRGCLKLICRDGSELHLVAQQVYEGEGTKLNIKIRVVKESEFTS